MVKNRRARNMILRVDMRTHTVRLTLPTRTSIQSGLQFATQKTAWIAAQMEASTRVEFAHGALIPLLGEQITVLHVGGRGVVRREENNLLIPGDRNFMARRVRDTIKQHLHAQITLLAASMSPARKITKIALRDTRSRWGSCSHTGTLSFSWRLAFAPPSVLHYVVAHEVAHLAHHNHSAAFWKCVETLCPDYEQQERWLKKHGRELWQWG